MRDYGKQSVSHNARWYTQSDPYKVDDTLVHLVKTIILHEKFTKYKYLKSLF